MGGMRVAFSEQDLEVIHVSVSTWLYRLRSAESLLAEDTLLLTTRERQYILELITELREAAEDGSTAIQAAIIRPRTAPEVDLGEKFVRGDR